MIEVDRSPKGAVPSPRVQEIPGLELEAGSRELVILLHAYNRGPESLGHVRKVISALRPEADFFIPRMPTATFSCVNPVEIVQGLLESVDQIVAAKGGTGYDQIILIGHSLGALLARKLYICAFGENGDAPFEPGLDAARPRNWSARVERIILLAGMNRGWSISHHLSIPNAVRWTVGSWLAPALAILKGREPLILTIHRGASFITQLRIQWLSMMRRARRDGINLAPTIQLLGSIDDMVSPEDNIDLVTGSEFVYLDVPMTGHANVIELDGSSAGQARRLVFERALETDPEVLKSDSLQPIDYQLESKERIKHVIFVIHGIRDEGFWTQKIARRVMAFWKRDDPGPEPTFASITSSYGYFPMLPFLLPSRRREKVQWLMDKYVEAMAWYPNADFHYVGHSNGTYLLARALRDNPSCHFSRVVFAGSIVRTDFDWASFQATRTLSDGEVTTPQVGPVLNYIATYDWVVAIFPKALELINFQDVGSAGHDGFLQIGGKAKGKQVTYVQGDHGAALREDNWDDIAHFIVYGDLPREAEVRFAREQSLSCAELARIAPTVWFVLLVLAVGVGWGIAYGIGNPFWRGAFVVGYVWSLYRFLTSF